MPRDPRRLTDVVEVPHVVGLHIRDAEQTAYAAGLKLAQPDPDGPPLAALTWPGNFWVTDQEPAAGSRRWRWDSIIVSWSASPGSDAVREPRRPQPPPRVLAGAGGGGGDDRGDGGGVDPPIHQAGDSRPSRSAGQAAPASPGNRWSLQLMGWLGRLRTDCRAHVVHVGAACQRASHGHGAPRHILTLTTQADAPTSTHVTRLRGARQGDS